MTLLDDLKREAEQLQLEREGEGTLESQKDALYATKIRPRMLSILGYLGDLIEQVELVNPDVRCSYELSGLARVDDLRQGGYILHTDNGDRPHSVRLRFYCAADFESQYPIQPKDRADETGAFLNAQRMRYSEWGIRDQDQNLIGITYQLRPTVEVTVKFVVDIDKGVIRMITTNFEEIGPRQYKFTPEKVTDQWLDDLGNFILRKHAKLHTLDLPSSMRDGIKERLNEEVSHRDQELKEFELRELLEQDSTQTKARLLDKLKNLANNF